MKRWKPVSFSRRTLLYGVSLIITGILIDRIRLVKRASICTSGKRNNLVRNPFEKWSLGTPRRQSVDNIKMPYIVNSHIRNTKAYKICTHATQKFECFFCSSPSPHPTYRSFILKCEQQMNSLRWRHTEEQIHSPRKWDCVARSWFSHGDHEDKVSAPNGIAGVQSVAGYHIVDLPDWAMPGAP